MVLVARRKHGIQNEMSWNRNQAGKTPYKDGGSAGLSSRCEFSMANPPFFPDVGIGYFFSVPSQKPESNLIRTLRRGVSAGR
jgi:hypothetical protein